MIASLTLRQGAAGLALVLGTVLVLGGSAAIYLREWRKSKGGLMSPGEPADSSITGWRGSALVLALLLVTVAGAWLRIHEISAKTLTHTEGMLPNLPWPPDSWPPARHSFYDTFWWHFHSELHPPAHYLLLWGWTKLFGTSLTSLRLPSALFGAGTIMVAYGLGARVRGRVVGVLAAAFVAFNGFHVFNSQFARVYMMGTFLALLSTLALLHAVGDGEHRRRWELTYVLSSCLAVYTQTFFWIVLAVQMMWVWFGLDRPEGSVRRVVGMQALVVMLGAAEIVHHLYMGAPAGYPVPDLAFIADYLTFGFAFHPDVLSIPERHLAAPAYWSFAALAVLLISLGSLAGSRRSRGRHPALDATDGGSAEGAEDPPLAALSQRALAPIAVGGALVTLAFVVLALRRTPLMWTTPGIPLMALGLPPLYGRIRPAFVRSPAASLLAPLRMGLSSPTCLLVLLGLGPAAALMVLALRASFLQPQALMIFSSYLLIVAAIGTWKLGRRRLLAVPLGLALIALHVGSVTHWRGYPNESRDYRALAERMNERMRRGDLVFVVPMEHGITPLFYYLDGWGYEYVTRDYADALEDGAADRVWLVYFESYEWGPFHTTTEEMRSALEGFRMEEEVDALRARAELYMRASAPVPAPSGPPDERSPIPSGG